MSFQKRIKDLLSCINGGMYEREEIIAVALLGALCGQNTFLYGPPGTAKSLISRRIACAFEEPAYFEYLMNRFSTPEDVFGPVSIKALKEDQYTRKTEKYLPKAEFAFLDEIWKSSPAILNTLLTLINERLFRNGEVVEPAPLKALIAASNETPDANQGLEALYDRFILRLMVGPIEEQNHFDLLLKSKPTEAKIAVSDKLRVSRAEWESWAEQIHAVTLAPETLTIIHLIRAAIDQQRETLSVYVSDRRWQRAAIVMKASAFFNDRKSTNHSDALLLQHCLWTHENNCAGIIAIVDQAVVDSGFDSGVSLSEIDNKKESLEKEITNEMFLTSDIYATEKINGVEHFKCKIYFDSHQSVPHFKWELYIPIKKMKSTDKFSPVDISGNSIGVIKCNFDGQGVCQIKHDEAKYLPTTFKPEIQFHKGDRKDNVNMRLVSSMANSVKELRQSLSGILNAVETKQIIYVNGLDSPFITPIKIKLAIIGITKQIEMLKLRIKDCERLEALCE